MVMGLESIVYVVNPVQFSTSLSHTVPLQAEMAPRTGRVYSTTDVRYGKFCVYEVEIWYGSMSIRHRTPPLYGTVRELRKNAEHKVVQCV